MDSLGITLKKELLIDMAKLRDGEIFPCGGHKTLDDCFTEHEGDLYLWYNTVDKHSRLISENTDINTLCEKENNGTNN